MKQHFDKFYFGTEKPKLQCYIGLSNKEFVYCSGWLGDASVVSTLVNDSKKRSLARYSRLPFNSSSLVKPEKGKEFSTSRKSREI